MDMRDQFDMFVLAISIHRILLHNKLLTLSFSHLCKFCFCISILCIFYFLSSIVVKIFTFFFTVYQGCQRIRKIREFREKLSLINIIELQACFFCRGFIGLSFPMGPWLIGWLTIFMIV